MLRLLLLPSPQAEDIRVWPLVFICLEMGQGITPRGIMRYNLVHLSIITKHRNPIPIGLRQACQLAQATSCSPLAVEYVIAQHHCAPRTYVLVRIIGNLGKQRVHTS